MYHFCIFEINIESKTHEYVDDFKDDFSAANEFCESMNYFRTNDMPVYFCVRCLDQEEFNDLENYSPFIKSVTFTYTYSGRSRSHSHALIYDNICIVGD